MRRLLPLLALLLLPATASAGWSADRAQTRAGVASGVRAAGGNGDRVALTWARRLGSTRRAELRLGRARDGFTQTPRVLDSSSASVEAPLPVVLPGGAFLAAWRRTQSGSPRIQYVTVGPTGRVSGKFNATTTGEPASEPQVVAGPVPALAWSRVTRADALEFPPTGLRGVRLPVAPRSEPGLATDANGLATAVWVHDGQVLVSDRGANGFGAPVVLADDPEANRADVVRGPGGATLVFWRSGVDLVVRVRPAGGSFGARRTVLTDTTDAARLAVTGTGEVLALAPVGDSSRTGQLQLARLGADGAPLGPIRILGRGRSAQLVADGTGSAFAAWLGEGAERSVTALRIAAGGIVGTPRRLADRSDNPGAPALGATREGGAVLAWATRGAVHARTYRP